MFKVLSLDGGGARGAFMAGLLAELEEKMGDPITDYFDLVAGTSSGSFIAVLLAIGHPMHVIEDIYSTQLSKIFTPNERFFQGILGRSFALMTSPITKYFTGVTLDELFKSKYSYEGTIALLKNLTQELKLKDLNKCRLIVPTTNLIHARPYVFKTSNLPEQSDNHNFYALDVILASSAAPAYFDPVTLPGHGIFSDGGIWANNPSLAAYAEAVRISVYCKRDVDPIFSQSDIAILSLGTGHAIDNFAPPYLKAGIKWWSKKLMELLFEAQTQSTIFYLENLLHEKFLRINFERPHRNWGQLDNYKYAKDMTQLGRLLARKKFSMIKDLFLSEKTKPFVPYTYS